MPKEFLRKIRSNADQIFLTSDKRKVLALVLVIGVLVFLPGYLSAKNVSFLGLGKTPDQIFTDKVSACNKAAKELRFSCYRTALEERFRGEIPEDSSLRANLKFTSSDASYAIFGTNCHTFYHSLGDYLASHLESTEADPLSYCSSDCTSGCQMGLIKRLSLESGFNSARIKELFDACPEDSVHQCAHEVGHVLHDKYVSSILSSLDEMSEKNYGLKYTEQFKYTTFDSANLDAPFEECRQIVPQGELNYCYTGIGHNLFLVSEFRHDNFQGEFDSCMEIAAANRDNCLGFLIFRIGINNAATEFLAGRVEEGIKVCEDTISRLDREDLKYHCYTGVGGGIGLFIDSDYDLSTTISTDVEFKLLEKAALCDRVEAKFTDNCYKGLLGTPFRDIYKNFKYKYPKIDEILGPVERDNFMVVG